LAFPHRRYTHAIEDHIIIVDSIVPGHNRIEALDIEIAIVDLMPMI
jgi:hypothetical protein